MMIDGFKCEVFKVRGVEFAVNAFGCLMWSADIETLYEPNGRDEWRGTNADLFKRGFGGRFFATPAFCDLTGFKATC